MSEVLNKQVPIHQVLIAEKMQEKFFLMLSR